MSDQVDDECPPGSICKFYSYEWTIENINLLSGSLKSLPLPVGVNSKDELIISINLTAEGLLETEIKIVSNEDLIKDNCFALTILDKAGNVLESEHGSMFEVSNTLEKEEKYLDVSLIEPNLYQTCEKVKISDANANVGKFSNSLFASLMENTCTTENVPYDLKGNIYNREDEKNNGEVKLCDDKIFQKEAVHSFEKEQSSVHTFAFGKFNPKGAKINLKNRSEDSELLDYGYTVFGNETLYEEAETPEQPVIPKCWFGQNKNFLGREWKWSPVFSPKTETNSASEELIPEDKYQKVSAEENQKIEKVSAEPWLKFSDGSFEQVSGNNSDLSFDKIGHKEQIHSEKEECFPFERSDTELASSIKPRNFLNDSENAIMNQKEIERGEFEFETKIKLRPIFRFKGEEIQASEIISNRKELTENVTFDIDKCVFDNTLFIRCGLGLKFKGKLFPSSSIDTGGHFTFYSSNKPGVPRSLQNLSKDIERIFKENVKLSDISSQVNCNNIKAHKALLYCRCPSLLSNDDDCDQESKKADTQTPCQDSDKVKFCLENLHLNEENFLSSKYLLKNYRTDLEDKRFETVNVDKNDFPKSSKQSYSDFFKEHFSVTTLEEEITSTDVASSDHISDAYSSDNQIFESEEETEELQNIKPLRKYEIESKEDDMGSISENSYDNASHETLKFQRNTASGKEYSFLMDKTQIKNEDSIDENYGKANEYSVEEKKGDENMPTTFTDKSELSDSSRDELENSSNIDEDELTDTASKVTFSSVIAKEPNSDINSSRHSHSSDLNFMQYSEEGSDYYKSLQSQGEEIEAEHSIMDFQERILANESLYELCPVLDKENSPEYEAFHESDSDVQSEDLPCNYLEEMEKVSKTSVSPSSFHTAECDKRSYSILPDDRENLSEDSIFMSLDSSHDGNEALISSFALSDTAGCDKRSNCSLSDDLEKSSNISDSVTHRDSPESTHGDSNVESEDQLNEFNSICDSLTLKEQFTCPRNSSLSSCDTNSNYSEKIRESSSSDENSDIDEEKQESHLSLRCTSICEGDNSVHIQDIDPHSFYWILRYIYSENLDLNNPFLFKFTCFRVYMYAVKYGLTQLTMLLAPLTMQVKTRIKTEKCSFQWTIEKYINSISYASPDFVTAESKIIWNVILNRDQNTLVLQLMRRGALKSNIQYSFTLIIEEHSRTHQIKSNPRLFTPQKDIVLPNVCINLDELGIETEYIESLIINCSIVIEAGHSVVDTEITYPISVTELNPINLSKDLGSLLISEEYSDVSLRAGNQSFDAHKFILAARSSTFATLLDNNPGNIFDLEGINGSTLESLLVFIYTGQVPDSKIDCLLYEAAINYRLRDLEELCRLYITKHLFDIDICKAIILAHKVRDFELAAIAKSYVCGHASEALLSPSGLDLITNHADIAKEIFKELATTYQKMREKS